MPDDGPRHFELENTFGKFRLRAKQPAQLAVLAPAAGSRRPTRRRPLGSISRDSLLWTAHELAAQRHGRLRWSTSPPGEYRPVPSFNPVIEGGIFRLQGTQVLENGFTPDGPGPGALNLFSAQLFSFRWSASNDSEAFDDAVATMVHSSKFSQSDDSQLKFKFRNDAMEVGGRTFTSW